MEQIVLSNRKQILRRNTPYEHSVVSSEDEETETLKWPHGALSSWTYSANLHISQKQSAQAEEPTGVKSFHKQYSQKQTDESKTRRWVSDDRIMHRLVN